MGFRSRFEKFHNFFDITSSARLFILTCNLGSLQIIWSTILSNGTPFLISLGFSKPLTALVWGFAPICGTFIQPYFGMKSDKCRSSMGRRKPFIFGGSIALVASLLGFAFSENIVYGFLRLLGLTISVIQAQMLVKANAVLFFCCLHIAIQSLQVGSRALIIENCGEGEQILVHAWASRMQGLGSIAGFFLASIPLSPRSPYGERGQFSVLCLLASTLLLATVSISCFAIEEQPRPVASIIDHEPTSFISELQHIWLTTKKVPRSLRRLFLIQCFAWMGWFPFLMYYTTYIAEAYYQSKPNRVTEKIHYGTELASLRVGSLTGLSLSIIALAFNYIFPAILEALKVQRKTKANPNYHSQRDWDTGVSSRTTKYITYIWALGHTYFALALWLTSFMKTKIGYMIIIASIGMSWASTLWAPYCLIGIMMSRLNRPSDIDEHGNDVTEAGAIMGLHNAAISAPQIASSLVCSIIFALTDGAENGIAWAFRVGGFWSVIAAYLSWNLIEKQSR